MVFSYRAVQSAIKRNDIEGLTRFLDKGLDPELSNENGWTLLMLAAVEGNVEMGKLLIEAGASTTSANAKGDTPLSIATSRNHAGFVELLTVPPQ
jgi:ankyrin repeat protein